jgi:NADH-quinone oxidoreductase subunit N
MNFERPDLLPVLPEIYMLCMACVVLLVDVYSKSESRTLTYLLTQATLFGALILTVSLHTSTVEYTFGKTFVKDPMSDVLKAFIYFITFVVFLYSRRYLHERGLLRGEYFVLGLFAVLGMMVMVSAQSLLLVYLGLELLALSLYAMVAFNRDSKESSEAAMKYFVLGALASGMLLYGMSLFYGAVGTLNMAEIYDHIKLGVDKPMVLRMGLVFIVIGIAFKLGAVPFHMWLPDVYHGSPTSVTLFIGTVPKIAAFGMMMRLLADGFQGMHVEWQSMLIALAMLSIAVGNVIAIAQTNIKRMLAYSTISHMGFLLLGILNGTADGYSSAMFYTIVYAIMGLGGFGMVILLSRAGFEADTLDDFKGLNERSPWFAAMMLLVMFSMAGVPPTVGFFAKLSVLQATVSAGFLWLAVFAVIFSVIGAFYYLRIVKLMYFDRPVDHAPIVAGPDMRLALSANGLAVLLLGIFPGTLMTVCQATLLH